MSEVLIQGVPDTALLVAAYRAAESERADALFSDPFAARLAGERGRRMIERIPHSDYAKWNVTIRTVVIDRFIEQAVREGVDTVLNLGAGLDTRPYRMALPAGLRWVEIDFPSMLAAKEQNLAGENPRCRLERVGMDLTDVKARRESLASLLASSKKAFVLTEGVVVYLASDVVAALAEDLRAFPQIQAWVVDYFSPETVRRRAKVTRKSDLGNAPFVFAPDDWFGFFEARGWKSAEERYIAEEAARLGRPFPMPWLPKLIFNTVGRFAPPEKRQAVMRFAGYVLLRPA